MSRSPLTVPEHPELPSEVRQVYVEIDRKFGVFILPQLEQLQAQDAVARLLGRGAELAQAAAEGAHGDLAAKYRQLLADAQMELREARAREVAQEDSARHDRQRVARMDQILTVARARLPQTRMSRLEARLSELDGEVGAEERVALVEAAVLEWERLSQTRQAREAERLADQAHLPVRPRHTETSRSRKALRDRARLIELARSFAMGEAESVAAGSGASEDRAEPA